MKKRCSQSFLQSEEVEHYLIRKGKWPMAKFAKYLQTGENVEVLESLLVNRTFYECKIETQQGENLTITRSDLLYPNDLELLEEF